MASTDRLLPSSGFARPIDGQAEGVVLAGGRSTRMGRDKAMLEVGGRPLWRRQISTLTAAGCAPVRLALAPRQTTPDPAQPCVFDSAEDCGPLAALDAALAACRKNWLAVLAVDLPGIDADWFRHLWPHCRPGHGRVARAGSHYEPLAAIFPREAHPFVAARLTTRQLALQPLVADLVAAGLLGVHELADQEKPAFANLNHPAAFAAWLPADDPRD